MCSSEVELVCHTEKPSIGILISYVSVDQYEEN